MSAHGQGNQRLQDPKKKLDKEAIRQLVTVIDNLLFNIQDTFDRPKENQIIKTLCLLFVNLNILFIESGNNLAFYRCQLVDLMRQTLAKAIDQRDHAICFDPSLLREIETTLAEFVNDVF